MSRSIGRAAYKPVGVLLGTGRRYGRRARSSGRSGRRPRATARRPAPTDEDRGWGEILAAAALQGAIFSVVRAAVDRGGAVGVRRLTGRWPD